MRILHTPYCSKARTALGLLTEAGYTPEIVPYREEGVLTPELLREIEQKAGVSLKKLLRKGEAESAHAQDLEGDGLRAFVCEHPVLLERPILIVGEKALVARPPERVWELVSASGPSA